MKPFHYHIHLEPDLEQFVFSGEVTLEIQANHPTHEVLLHARELEFQRCTLLQDGDEKDCTFILDAVRQEATIQLPEPIHGEFALTIAYSGLINDQYAGLYRSKYVHSGGEKYLASTQFEAKDARRAFPCFDQPGLKATFDIEYVIPTALTGISNAALAEEKDLGNGTKLVRFERTPKMSTYLVFFGIGEFEFIEDAFAVPLIRVVTTPGKTQYGQFALEMARKSLQFGANYTGIPYPLSKCDYIAVPDSIGAMENYGAIRHAEDVLLVYPDSTPKARRTLIAKIIAHEGIHMWFGDLVSPAAWKDLWLNEAFATYFTFVIPHHFSPEWGVWEQFFPERVLSGLERDALAGTIPIDLPNVDDPDADPAPTPSTAPIVYNKGAAVIRMLAAYLGEDLFRQGIYDYLAQYQFDAASSEQFWDAIAESTGVPVSRFAETWIYQPGYPLVDVTLRGDSLQLSQRRFSYSDNVSESLWIIPVDVTFYLESGETRTIQVVLDQNIQEILAPEGMVTYKLNTGLTGFYRVNYPRENWQRLGKMLRDKRLSNIDSLNVLNDFFALVKAGVYSVEEYLGFIDECCWGENRYLPLTDIAKNLSQIYLVDETKRAGISRLGAPIFERVLEAIGYQPDEDEPLLTTELRAALLVAAFLLGSNAVAGFGNAQFQLLVDDEFVHPDILTPVMKIGAVVHPDAQSWLVQRALDENLSEAERIMALEALGHLRTEKELRNALAFNLDEIPRSFKHYMLAAAAQNPSALDWMWRWFREHLCEIEKFPLHVVEMLIVQLIPLCGLGHRNEVHAQLQDFVSRYPTAADSVTMALELLDVNERLRNHQSVS